jgi:hypothetical protein
MKDSVALRIFVQILKRQIDMMGLILFVSIFLSDYEKQETWFSKSKTLNFLQLSSR